MKTNGAGHILVVDDEETMRRSLADILRLEGYKVQAVATGELALEMLKRESVDLVLLDLKMPGMDGLEVLRTISQIAPETIVILLTAHGSLESAIEALRHHAFDYLLKPSTPGQIVSTVKRALLQRAETQAKRDLIDQINTSLQRLRDVEKGARLSSTSESVAALGTNLFADLARRQVWSGQDDTEVVDLTPTEGKLLSVLLENAGRVLSHRELVQKVQGYEVTDWEAPEVLRPLVSRLRQKLAQFPGGEDLIINVRGTGYVFERRSRDRDGSWRKMS